MRGGAGVSEESSARTEAVAWYAVAQADAKLVTQDGRVVTLRRVSGSYGSGKMSPANSVSPETVLHPSGAVYGKSFKPAPKTMKPNSKALDPVILTGLTKSGNSTDGWTLNATWSGGAAPYTVVSSTDPSFQINVVTNAAEFPSFNLNMKVDSSDSGKFFNVVDGTTVSPAVQGSGLDPLPAPQVTSASTANAWWGDRITLTGKYFSPIASENLAFLNDLGVRAAVATPPSSGAFSDSVEFDIPEDARSFLAVVYSYGKSDRTGAPVVFMSPPNIGPYTQITGVSWSPQTGHVWVAAQGVVEDVDLFQVTPTALPVGTFSRPYISRVTTAGRILVIDRDSSGVIEEIDPMTRGITTFALTMDDGFSRAIDPVGLAVDPNGAVAYVADGGSGRVVRIPRDAGPGSSEITDQWGGRDFSFVDPVGIDVAPGHQVIVADNASQYTWQLTGPSSASSQHWAGQNVHAIEVDRGVSSTGYSRYVIDTAAGMTETFNRNEIGSQAQVRYHGGRVYGLADGTLRLNYDWVYGDLRRGPKRVLLSNAVSTYPYPTQFQTTDWVIELKGEAWAGVNVHLRLIDPPDLAAYAPVDGWTDAGDARPPEPPYEGNDNVVWGWQGGEDYGLSLNPTGPWNESVFATPGADHTYTYYLKVPVNNSGENFQVEITKCDAAGAVLQDQVVGMSGVYTSWKRIFVERDKMFRKGGVLADDYLTEPGTCGAGHPKPCCGDAGALPCDQVKVYEWTNVAVGDEVAFFDEEYPYEDGRAEVKTVLGTGSSTDGLRAITLSGSLSRNFLAATRTEDPPYQPTFDISSDGKRHSAGFGVISGCDLVSNQINAADSCFFEGDLRGIERPFGDAFVEFQAPRDGMNAVPYVGEEWFNYLDLTWLTRLSHTWFKNYELIPTRSSQESGVGSSRIPSRHNYFHVLGTSAQWEVKPNGNTTYYLGQTQLAYDFSFLFRASAERVVVANGGSDPQKDSLCQRTAVHELGHQFNVNGCIQPPGTPHDSRPSWCDEVGGCEPGAVSPQKCVMDITAPINDRWDESNRFCKQDLFLGDPTCSQLPNPPETTIRGQEDPF